MTTTRRRSTRKSPAGTFAAALDSPPAPVRLGRVRLALKRIASGYYDRDEVRTRLAVAVLEELRRN
jgi:hypothetical protein